MSYKVKTIPKFEKELKRLAKKFPSLKYDFSSLLQSLKEDPARVLRLVTNAIKYVCLLKVKARVNQAEQELLHALKLYTERFIC